MVPLARSAIADEWSHAVTKPGVGKSCNYSDGKWVWAPGHVLRYNATREKELEWVFREIRDVVYDVAAEARRGGGGGETTVRIEVLDVTKLASMRPDGHPGVYMNRDPFANGVDENMFSDCLHFCLPGPVDTFNEILVQLLKKWR
uniref:Trichome birefringence-like C-terminal domain-containing protein n=1 Tax=Oryza barthii TaxID=65489 RepID=A0A0D3GPA6_9ORYZ